MIQAESRIKVADNSGARKLCAIRQLAQNRHPGLQRSPYARHAQSFAQPRRRSHEAEIFDRILEGVVIRIQALSAAVVVFWPPGKVEQDGLVAEQLRVFLHEWFDVDAQVGGRLRRNPGVVEVEAPVGPEDEIVKVGLGVGPESLHELLLGEEAVSDEDLAEVNGWLE